MWRHCVSEAVEKRTANLFKHLICTSHWEFCSEFIYQYYPLSHVWLFVIPWTVAQQAPLSMEFSRQDTEVSSHSFLQGIFQTQGLNPYLLNGRRVLYHVSKQGNLLFPKGAYKFKSRDTKIFFTNKKYNIFSCW